MTVQDSIRRTAVRNGYEESLAEHWETKQSDPINLLLGEMDGLYHHHYAIGDFNRNLLDAPNPERDRLILKEMHRLENDQVDIILDELRDLRPESRVMDAGSGRGGTSFMIHDRYGCHVDGVNFCTHHLAFAEQLARERSCTDKVRFHYANMTGTPFEDAGFDAVTTNETTMYVDLFEAFAEFSRLLRPGGRYVLVTWCRNDATGEDAPEIDQINEHYVSRIHRRSTYLKALADNGLVPSMVRDFTQEAIPYWELRNHSTLRTGIEDAFLSGYRRNVLNYIAVTADRTRG